MNPLELRIGNHFNIIDRSKEIHIPNPTVMVVRALGFSEVYYCREDEHPEMDVEFKHVPYHNIAPIPITEEWLLKSNFPNNFFYQEVHAREVVATCDIPNIIGTLKYVHRLQNLYLVFNGPNLVASVR